MTTMRVARRKPDPLRRGMCPTCYRAEGSPCQSVPGVKWDGVIHDKRVEATIAAKLHTQAQIDTRVAEVKAAKNRGRASAGKKQPRQR